MYSQAEQLMREFPDVRIDHDNAFFYQGLLEGRYLIQRCDACETWQTPPRAVCAHCWSTTLTPTEISGFGTIHLLTLLHQGPAVPGIVYDPPYPLAVIELDEQQGLRIPATLIDCPQDQLHIGLKVRLAWVHRQGRPQPAFRPESRQALSNPLDTEQLRSRL